MQKRAEERGRERDRGEGKGKRRGEEEGKGKRRGEGTEERGRGEGERGEGRGKRRGEGKEETIPEITADSVVHAFVDSVHIKPIGDPIRSTGHVAGARFKPIITEVAAHR